MWTDLVGEKQVGPKGVYWDVKDTVMRHWSFQVYRKDGDGPLLLTFAYRVDKAWIPSPLTPILEAVGDRDKLNVSVRDRGEERLLVIDYKRHRFHSEPFSQSISTLPPADKEEMERVLTSGVSKKAINFILEALSDINEREAAELKASRKQKKKQAETLLKARNDDGGRTKPQRKQNPNEGDVGGTSDPVEKLKKKPAEVVPRDTPLNPMPLQQNDPHETAGSRKPTPQKRALSPEKRSKQKKMKATDLSDDNPVVLTATERGRVIAHGEEPSLAEAAADRKKFVQLFGHLYPFGVDKVFHVNIKNMIKARSYQVTRPLDVAGVALMKNYLIQTPPAWPHHNLCLMPKFEKGETWKEGMTWDDIKDGQFIIINGQHSVAASREIILHKDTEKALKDKLKVWPCTIVWTEDPSMTVRLSYTLNNSNSFNKFTPTWTTQIMYCRRVWVKLGQPQKQRANAVSPDPKMAEAWKVGLHYFSTPHHFFHTAVWKFSMFLLLSNFPNLTSILFAEFLDEHGSILHGDCARSHTHGPRRRAQYCNGRRRYREVVEEDLHRPREGDPYESRQTRDNIFGRT